MKRFILAAGVAALAISVPAVAEKGGHGGGKSHAAKSQGGKAKAKSGKAHAAKAQRSGKARAAKADRVKRYAALERKSDRRVEKARAKSDSRLRAATLDRREDRARAIAKLRDRDRDLVRARDFDDDRRFDRRVARRGYDGDCPPGLAKKTPACIPPGLAKNMVGQRFSNAYAASVLPTRLRSLYRDSDDHYYRYGNGYVYKVDRDTQLVNSLLPLFGAGLGVGQLMPSAYSNAYVPNYYRSFYPETSDNYYRYANGYVYGVDRGTGLIENIVPLMASGYGLGQMLPAGYSAYNVPYQYRDRYYDTGDNYYRYAPGAIYQVDPKTQLVTAIASLLSPNGFAVGQPMPAGYGAYNVPYSYRDQYYDTADNWYRYNNGNIYQVDPTTQLITAVIRAIV